MGIDHIEPVAHGGTDELSNLQVLCRSCNQTKGAPTAAAAATTVNQALSAVGSFYPSAGYRPGVD